MVSKLDIDIPVYNEGENIVSTLRAIAREVRTPARVLLIYDDADDNTLAAVKKHRNEFGTLNVELLQNKNHGAHAAVMTGFASASAPYVVMFPADDDYNPAILDAMVARGQEGADIVCASRFMPGGSMVGCPALKAVLVRSGNWLLHHVARIPTRDASNGFRFFSRRVIAEIPIESSTGFCYSIEYLVKAHRLGWRIDEVPAQWFERKSGKSRFKVLRWLPAYLRWCGYALGTVVRRWARAGRTSAQRDGSGP